jgi:hypothetical protein
MFRKFVRWKNKPQRDAARTLLCAEEESNLGVVQSWWSNIKPRKSEDEIHWVDKVVYARELADAAPPEFSRDAYLRFQPSLSQYLRGGELSKLTQFYKDLTEIEVIQQQLRAALDRDIELRRSLQVQPSSGRKPPPTFEEFLRIAAPSWARAARLIDTILTRGNTFTGLLRPRLSLRS